MSIPFQSICFYKSEAIAKKSIKYLIIFFMSFSVFNTSANDTPLDGSGGNVNINSSHYQEQINRLNREIADLNSQISAKQTELENLRRTCNPGSKNGCDFQIISLENMISQLQATLQQKTAEKTRAEENHATTSEYEQALREAEASRDATIAAKKKVEKQKKLLKLTALVNTGASAYLFKKCYACSPNCTNFCIMGYAASAQALATNVIANKLGGVANKLAGVGGIPGNVCQMFPSVCTPSPGICQTDPDACGPPPGICQTNPDICDPGPPPTLPTDICQTNPDVCTPPVDICQTNPDACAPPVDICQTNPDACNPNPEDCATNPSLPHCTNIHPCPDGISGEECVTMTQTCPTAEGQCSYTMPTDPGAFAGNSPPSVTVNPLDGGKPWKASMDISDIDMNDPEIKKAMEELEKNQAPLHKQLAALEQELDLPSSADGDFGLNGSISPDSDSGKSKKSGKGEGEFAGNNVYGSDDEGGSARGKKTPHKNLMSQFRGRKNLKRDIIGEKSITFGEDKIGVTEDNIFLMTNRTYEEYRKANEFIEDPIPSVSSSESSL